MTPGLTPAGRNNTTMEPQENTVTSAQEDAWREEDDAEVAALLECMSYPPGGTLPPPPPLPEGRVLVHNNVRHSRRTRQGENGFRFWLQDCKHPAAPWVGECSCGYAPEHELHCQVIAAHP